MFCKHTNVGHHYHELIPSYFGLHREMKVNDTLQCIVDYTRSCTTTELAGIEQEIRVYVSRAVKMCNMSVEQILHPFRYFNFFFFFHFLLQWPWLIKFKLFLYLKKLDHLLKKKKIQIFLIISIIKFHFN